MKLTIIQNNEILKELDSEGLSNEQLQTSSRDLQELILDSEVIEWNLKFKDGTPTDALYNLDNLGIFITEQVVTIK